MWPSTSEVHGSTPDSLSIELIRRTLETETVGRQIFLFGDIASTNRALRHLAEGGAREGTVVLAESQYAGGGRLGRVWHSPPGVNLYASVLFRRALAPSQVAVFSFITSLALTDAIWAEGVPAGIKWPNDVLVDGKKVAGTRVALATARDRVDYVILGAGVNLNVDDASLKGALGDAAARATSLARAAGRLIDRNVFAAAFLNFIEKWLLVYTLKGPEAVLAAWRARDVTTGRRVAVSEARERYQGCVVGTDDAGRLVVQDAGGARRRVIAGQIELLD